MYQLLLMFSAWAEVRQEAGEEQQEGLPFQMRIWVLYSQSLVHNAPVELWLFASIHSYVSANPVDEGDNFLRFPCQP